MKKIIGIIMWKEMVEMVEGPVVCVGREKVLQALSKTKTVIVPGSSNMSLELVAVSGKVGLQVIAEICQMVLDGHGISVEWALCIVVPIFKGRGGIRNCCYHKDV